MKSFRKDGKAVLDVTASGAHLSFLSRSGRSPRATLHERVNGLAVAPVTTDRPSMWIMRLLLLISLFSPLARFATSADDGGFVDPNGGATIDGGGAMDPNGGTSSVGSGIDPDGVR